MDGVSVDVGKFVLNWFVPVHTLAEASRADVFTEATLVSTYIFVVRSVVFAGVTVDVGKLVLNAFVPSQRLFEL